MQKFSLDVKAYVISASYVLAVTQRNTGISYCNQKLINNYAHAQTVYTRPSFFIEGLGTRLRGTQHTEWHTIHRGAHNTQRGTQHTVGHTTHRGAHTTQRGTHHTEGHATRRGARNTQRGTQHAEGHAPRRGAHTTQRGTHHAEGHTPHRGAHDTYSIYSTYCWCPINLINNETVWACSCIHSSLHLSGRRYPLGKHIGASVITVWESGQTLS